MNAFWWRVRNVPHRLRGWKQEAARMARMGLLGELRVTVRHPDGTVLDLGVVSRRVVTTIGAAFVVDALQNLTEIESLNFHDSGTSSTAEAVGDTGCIASAGPARVTGTQSEPSSTVYRSRATVTYTTTQTITEHCLHWASSGANTGFDRSVFTGIPVVNGSQIEFTYDLTVATGT